MFVLYTHLNVDNYGRPLRMYTKEYSLDLYRIAHIISLEIHITTVRLQKGGSIYICVHTQVTG